MIHFVESDSGNESEKRNHKFNIIYGGENENNPLIIMAAGIGSRFGTGIKQLGKDGSQWGDYYGFFDLRCERSRRFYKSCFVIRRAIEKEFKEVIGNRLSKVMPVEYVYQELEDLPEGYLLPEGRGETVGNRAGNFGL